MVKSSLSCCDKEVGLKKGPWTPEEDEKLTSYIQQHGHYGSWSSLPAKAGLKRCGKSCRLRWNNYLRPDIKRGNFSSKEDQTIIQLHALLGNKWSVIAHHLPKRTDNEIKNYWNTCLKKKLTRMGINPNTHKPFNNDAADLSHMAQWEIARLQAEARQVKEYCNLQQLQKQLGSSSSSSSSQPSLTRLVLNRITPRPSPPPCLDVLRAWQNSWSSADQNQNTPKMHSMYAMMLATDDLESPASTLSFPDTAPTNANCTDNNATFGLINQSALPSSSSSSSSAATTTVANDRGPWRNKELSVGDNDNDNITTAVEAFRSRGYNCNSTEDLHDEDLLVYGFTENSPIPELNLGVSSFGEVDWEAILDLVNGPPPSPTFPSVL